MIVAGLEFTSTISYPSFFSALQAFVQDRTTGEWSFARIYEEKDMEFIKTEKIPYYKKMLEEARYLPLRSAPILDIICEEAEDYFNGDKSAEEVIKVIENRVKLYVNERKSD